MLHLYSPVVQWLRPFTTALLDGSISPEHIDEDWPTWYQPRRSSGPCDTAEEPNVQPRSPGYPVGCKLRIPAPRSPKIAQWTCSGDVEARVLQRSTAKYVGSDVDGRASGGVMRVVKGPKQEVLW